MSHPLELALPGVRGLAPYEPGKPIEALQRELGVSDVVKLASNENPLGPSPKALAVARDCLHELARYPDGGGFALKHALAAKLHCAPENLTLGNGSNDILELATRAFVSSEHEVIYSDHAFAIYPIVTQAVGAHAVVTQADHWGHDLSAMRKAVTPKTRLVFIANPNNPTGTWVNATALEEFIQSLPDHVLVVVDEAYFDYVTDTGYPNTLSWVGRYPNLVVTRTFSKAYGLAGLRIGYSVSQAEIAEILNRVRQPFNVNSVALAAAEAALEDDAHLDRAVTTNTEGMQQLTSSFAEMGLDYIPSVANFICLKTGRPGIEVYRQLLQREVIVRPVDNYGMPDYIRVTISTPEENQRFIDALQQVLAGP